MTEQQLRQPGAITKHMHTQNKSRSAVRAASLVAALALGVVAAARSATQFTPTQTLSQSGIFPVNGLAGDAFGQVTAFNKEYLFVSSPGSQPGNRSIAGAVFVYRWDGTQYQQTQVISTAGTGDHLAMLQITSEHDWLVLGVGGTPIGPQVNDGVGDQDFRGAALIYRVDDDGQWQLTQTIDSSTPGLQDLSTIGGGGIPVLLTPQGANLGLRSAIDAEHGWLFVSALYQNGVDAQNQIVMNAGKVYAFRLDRANGTWVLAQAFTNPDGFFANDAFGASVAVKGRYAVVGNGSVFQGPHVGNSAVYVYRLDGSTWSYVQRLNGTQNLVTPLFFPQFHTNLLGVGDAFGNAIALDQDDMVVTAPLESRNVPGAVYTGAAYFYRREQVQGEERWVLKQRVESEDPNSFTFGVFNVALSGSTAVIGDIGWTGAAAVFQGAAHVYRRTSKWEKQLTLTDPQGTTSAAFGASMALGPDGRLAVGSSPFLGFFVPVIFHPPPMVGPPVAPGKVIIYEPAED